MSQDVIVRTHGDISTYLGIIPGRVNTWARTASEATDLSERVNITDDETAGAAAAVVKSLTTNIKELEAERKRYTGPIDDLRKVIYDSFALSLTKLTDAKKSVNDVLTIFLRQREIERRAEQERERRAAEALAAAARADGDEIGAADIESLAGKLDGREVVRNTEYDATASVRTIISGSVSGGENKREFLKWAATNLDDEDLDQIVIGQRLMNKVAKRSVDAKRVVPGLLITESESARVA